VIVVVFVAVHVDWVRSSTGLLFILQMIYEYGEPWLNNTDRGKVKNSKKNLSQCHFVHHKSHMDVFGLELVSPR
jgi:hypothetical protein